MSSCEEERSTVDPTIGVSDLLGAYQRTRLVGTIKKKEEGNLLPGYAIILVGCAGFVVTVNMWIYDRAYVHTFNNVHAR